METILRYSYDLTIIIWEHGSLYPILNVITCDYALWSCRVPRIVECLFSSRSKEPGESSSKTYQVHLSVLEISWTLSQCFHRKVNLSIFILSSSFLSYVLELGNRFISWESWEVFYFIFLVGLIGYLFVVIPSFCPVFDNGFRVSRCLHLIKLLLWHMLDCNCFFVFIMIILVYCSV